MHHLPRPDDLSAISASLEAVCARLAQLRLPGAASALSPDAAGHLEAVLADPGAHRPLLEQLASIAAGDGPLCAAFLAYARELGDRLPEPDDGYPPIEARAAQGTGTGTGSDSDSDSDHEPSSSSDTAAADRLSDEDAEDLLPRDSTHALRAGLRAKIRAGGAPEWFGEALSAAKEEGRACSRWWSGEESEEDQALAREASQERAESEDALRSRLEEAQAELGDSCGSDAAPGSGAAPAAEDELDELLGFVVPVSEAAEGPEKKRARRAQQFAAAEARLDARDEEEARRAAARDELEAALETYCELTGMGQEGYDAPREGPVEQLAWEAEGLLDQYEGEDDLEPGAYQGAAQQCVAALRARLDAFVGERPDLKRKRADLEALDEILAEQRSAEPILGGPAFARLVQEIGQDCRDDFRIDAGGLAALQAAADEYLVGLLGAGGRAAAHAGRTYLAPEDIQLARGLRGELP